MVSSINLPQPDEQALAHSEKLLQIMRTEAATNAGLLTFARYMELALYTPNLGYYSAGLHKFGEQGDFVTAPEISPLFAQCLAQQCSQVLQTLGEGEILEFGAGSGIMAADLLLALERENQLPSHYSILEVSADLRQRQQQTLQTRVPHLFDRIYWLDQLPAQPLTGVILANEVLDAMPVQRFRVDDAGIHEFYVTWEGDQLAWQLGKPQDLRLVEKVQELALERTGEHYDSEVNLLLPGWLKSVSACLERGLVLLIDYGFPRAEFYHPDRSMGTLMCHYRHLAHPNPLILTGLQDITAHVDFTAVAEAALANKLKVAGFTSQAAFLLGCGLLDLATAIMTESESSQIKISQQIQKLTSPNEMGELFKVMALSRGLEPLNLRGFAMQDRRQRL